MKTNFKHPKWINSNLRQFLSQNVRRNHNFKDEIEIVIKEKWTEIIQKFEQVEILITAPEMEKIWRRADKNYSRNFDPDDPSQYNILDGQIWLCQAIFFSLPHKKTLIAQENEWKNELVATLERLAHLITRAPNAHRKILGTASFKLYLRLSNQCIEFTDYCRENNLPIDLQQSPIPESVAVEAILRDCVSESRVLDPKVFVSNLLHVTETTKPLKTYWTTRRAGAIGDRAYFVRSLTNLFILRTGEPKREAVREITNRIFSSNSITEKQIRAITTDIVAAPEDFLYALMQPSFEEMIAGYVLSNFKVDY